MTERARWWWGTAPSEITGESIKQYSRQTPVFLGTEGVSSTLGREDTLEEEMATHSSTLDWKIPWTEETDGLQSMGPQRVGRDCVTRQQPRRWSSGELHLERSQENGRASVILTAPHCEHTL